MSQRNCCLLIFCFKFSIELWILFTGLCCVEVNLWMLKDKMFYIIVSCWQWWPSLGVLSRPLFLTFLWHNQNESAYPMSRRSHFLPVIFNTSTAMCSFKELFKKHSVVLVYWIVWRRSAPLRSHSLVGHGARACLQINVVQLHNLQLKLLISRSWFLNRESHQSGPTAA